MAKTCTIIKDGRADTYGRPLLVGQSYTGPDDEVFSLWQTGFATVNGAPGAFLPATEIRQQVIAQCNIPFLIMPGDGAANGCQFTGTNGAFTLSAAIIANIGTSLAGCYAYFSAGFGGSSLPAGWYWTEFSSDTAGIVYAETYTSGKVRRPATKTAIAPNLSGWVTGTTNEITGVDGLILPAGTLGKNGNIKTFHRQGGSVTGNKNVSFYLGGVGLARGGSSGSPMVDMANTMFCLDSHTSKHTGRLTNNAVTGITVASASMTNGNVISIDTSVDQLISCGLQSSTNVGGGTLLQFEIIATYGE
jgi:hypothetical protein